MPSAVGVTIPPVGAPPSARSRLALFDLDRTLLPGSSLTHLARRLAASGLLSRRAVVAALTRQAAFRRRGATQAIAERSCERALAVVAGLAVELIDEVVAFAAIDVAALLRPAMLEIVARHRAAGDVCVLLSASPHELVVDVAARAGLDHAVGTRVEVRDGLLTGRLDGPFCHAEGKLARLRDELGVLDLSGATAYADAGTDLPVLQACGFPVAVNPDRALRAAAKRGSWPVIDL